MKLLTNLVFQRVLFLYLLMNAFFSIDLPLSSANTTTQISKPHIDVEFVSEVQSIQPGKKFYVGFYFRMEKHWHIYWQNPGDSGQPPRVRWTLPPEVTMDPVLWPIPMKIHVGPLLDYGYENEVLLIVPMHASENIKNLAELHASLSWLVCKESCVPGKAELEMHLPVQSKPAAPNLDWAGVFRAARQMMPLEAPQEWQFKGVGDSKKFHLTLDQSASMKKVTIEEATFIPYQENQIENSGAQQLVHKNGITTLEIPRSEFAVEPLTHLTGLLLLSLKNDPSEKGYEVDFSMNDSQPRLSGAYSSSLAQTSPDQTGVLSSRISQKSSFLAQMTLLALAALGGLILNFMPCVFPVLAIKMMSLLQLSGQEAKKMRVQAWMYALGNLVSFWVLAGILLGFRFAGQQMGWGFQLQSPRFLVLMSLVLFFFGLNLLGIFEIGASSLVGVGSRLTQRSGNIGSFFTGVFATLVATPCTAPFMGSAVGFALTQPGVFSIFIFTFLALGFASPFVVFAYWPQLVRVFPRPGRWMEILKQGMAFPIFGTLIWLAWVLSHQVPPEGLILLMIGFLLVGFSAWVMHRWGQSRRIFILFIMLNLVTIACVVYFLPVVKTSLNSLELDPSIDSQDSKNTSESDLPWEKFSPERLKHYRDQGKPVFVDFTASWCVSCKVNEMLVFSSTEVKKNLKDLGVVLLKADWTTQDPVITKTLESFGRSGVPFYILYGKGKNSLLKILPEVITAGMILEELKKIKNRDN